jgi:hypothetical protein
VLASGFQFARAAIIGISDRPEHAAAPDPMTAQSRTDAHLGILMLATRFPRPPGDVGNPATFGFPVCYALVEAATPRRVVREHAAGLLPAFVDAARGLVDRGAAAISTSCGFLALFQRELADALPVPVATSSLLQAAWLAPLLPAGRTCGVVTIDASALGREHLGAVGAPLDLPVEGVDPAGEFASRILNDEPTLDLAVAERDVVAAAARLVARRPDVAAIVLECTNMPPYAAAVRRATGRPVYDAVTMLDWFWRGLLPPGRP